MVLTLEVVLAVAVLFAAGAFALGRLPGVEPAPVDAPGDGLPDGPLAPADLARARFGLAFRGYRMAEVDAVLDRLEHELAERDTKIERLRSAPHEEPHASLGAAGSTGETWPSSS